MNMSVTTSKLVERVAQVEPGTLQRIQELRQQYPRWREGEGFIGSPDRTRYFAKVLQDRNLERLHFSLARN